MSIADKMIIQADNLYLQYTLPHLKTKTLKDAVFALIKHGLKNSKFFAINDVSFKVHKGETFGIIGDNGAGKSTLLKVISGILQPDKGTLVTNGVVSSLLELGAGIHPDLTGRENIFLSGSILGLKTKFVKAKYDHIVEFSGLGKFINSSVRSYSTGMYMRLGFSIATILAPDILLIDEILAVGDISFQKKCFQKFNEFKKEGKTILFVSHDLRLVKRICNRTLWIDNGKVVAYGDTGEIISKYINRSREKERKLEESSEYSKRVDQGIRESKAVSIKNIEVIDSQNKLREEFSTGDDVIIKVNFNVHEDLDSPVFGIAILRSDGVYVYGPNTREDNVYPSVSLKKGEKGYFKITYEKTNLLAGDYFLHIGIFGKDEVFVVDAIENIYGFRIKQNSDENVEGLIKINHQWEVYHE
ncbi:MAG: hypothetical protein CMD96_08945 [Gammaproteobacteria bacterium]|jgi:ABC-type polysaccharide/polyol phosphate transport system ATPase subunit|nr:hypothetical protein [Gammaproteobacteria bacterium]HJP17083.1 ABC transporter ATP-binding protein [Nitrospinota bacterium]|tara:strand:- start:10463 stop:11707 length:1245 start_codon:yes stop_codon:yes gene_type:complete